MLQKLSNNRLENMINNVKIPIRLSCITSTGYPIVVSLWYTIINNKIYCATQKNSKIVSYVEENPRFGFEIAADNPPYRGVRGYGEAKIIKDSGKDTLDSLIKKYLGEKKSNLSEFLKKNSENEVAIQISPKKIITYDYSKRMKDA